MRVIGCILVILPIIFFLLIRNKKEDFFSPKSAFTFLYFIEIVLSVWQLTSVDSIREENGFLYSALIDDSCFLKYCILQSISYILVMFGINTIQKKTTNKEVNCVSISPALAHSYLVWGILFYIIGVVGFFLIMRKVGGIVYFFSNLQYRRLLVRDLDFETMLLSFLNNAPLLIIFSKRYSGKKMSIVDILLIILAGLMSGLGGRKALLMLFIECIFIYHFAIKRINIKVFLKPVYILLAVFLFFFFSLYSQLRREGAVEEFLNNPIAFYQENSEDGVLSTVAGESYVPFYIAIIDYFRDHEYWHGASFKGLLTAPIPSSFYKQKPPVDDGMYLFSIAQGNPNIKPVMPASSLDGTSWPLETFGSMYANFGTIGVLVGMLILGLIIGWSYKKMILSGSSFLWLLMYVNVLFTFELSTLRIFQVFLSFVTLAIVSFFANKILA